MRVILAIFLMVLITPLAIAQEGCGTNRVDTSSPMALTKSLESSLWTFRSSVWNGYIDFQGGGRFWTHWGYGRWTVSSDRSISLTNDYDGYTHQMTISYFGNRFSGKRSDGVEISGTLICGQYASGISDLGLESAKASIMQLYRELLNREAEPAGLQFWLSVYQQRHSIDDVRNGIMSSAEYHQLQSRGVRNENIYPDSRQQHPQDQQEFETEL